MKSLGTNISLPFAPLTKEVLRTLLERIFGEYKWFQPVRYGLASMKERLDPEHIDYDALLSYFEAERMLCVGSHTDQRFIWIFSSKQGSVPRPGELAWTTPTQNASAISWRDAHLQQVTEVMRLVGSPLAVSATREDLDRKAHRLVPAPDGFGTVEEFTVRDYSEGLSGLFWRTFFGPPFVRMFGERLRAISAEFKQELGDGLVLVQPYELPAVAGTPDAIGRERELIAHLGAESFYDHERHLKPQQLPVLGSHRLD